MNLAMEANERVAGHEPRPQDRTTRAARPRRLTAAFLAALAPGALLGAHLALLLFFLNPHLDLGTPTVLRAVAVLALALGVNEDATSYALRLLRTAGLVQSRKVGRTVVYRLADQFPEPLLAHCLRELIKLSRAV